MGSYRTTVILKTDIVDSTPRLSEQTQAEMGLQRRQHKQFITDTTIQHRGSVLDEEGDGYWLEFPSVTQACLAAIDMHQNLRSAQAGKGEKHRLAIRAIITVGDILHQGHDTIGMTLSLTARIEKITPPDEIYLSHAAWLVLNKAEIQASFVNEFNFKGFREPEKIYKVDQKSGIRVLTDQCIVLADAKGFSNLFRAHGTEVVEKFLLEYEDLMNAACEKHGGIIRQVNGDLFFMTFEKADQALSAIKTLCLNWTGIVERYNVGMEIGVHKGELNLFRSYVFGNDINITMLLTDLCGFYGTNQDRIFVIASGKIRDELMGTDQYEKFLELDMEKITQENHRISAHEHGAFRFIIENDQ
jgi:class 3 adenylate cyclase